MKPAVPAPPVPQADLSLCLLEDVGKPPAGRLLGVGAASVVVNIFILLTITSLASIEGTPPPPRPRGVDVSKATPLLFPRELTQKAPNRDKVAKEMHLEELIAKPETKPQRRVFTPPPAPKRVREQPAATPAVEPPNIKVAQAAPPALGVAPDLTTPPPQIQAQEKPPKLTFETPGVPSGPASRKPAGMGRLAPPGASIDETVRSAGRTGPGGVVVGELPDETGIGQALGQTPTPGRQASQVELLSDPLGVDFKPYLIRVLAAVRRNWFSVIPESVRFGRRGRVVIQFSISKTGSVPKLVIATPSGTEALDRAAVAGISASNPFPPLPAEFKGDQIRVQLVFSYNAPVR